MEEIKEPGNRLGENRIEFLGEDVLFSVPENANTNEPVNFKLSDLGFFFPEDRLMVPLVSLRDMLVEKDLLKYCVGLNSAKAITQIAFDPKTGLKDPEKYLLYCEHMARTYASAFQNRGNPGKHKKIKPVILGELRGIKRPVLQFLENDDGHGQIVLRQIKVKSLTDSLVFVNSPVLMYKKDFFDNYKK